MSAGDLSTEELCVVERNRVRKLLTESEEPLKLESVSEAYEGKHKVELKFWKEEFSRFEAFLRYGCDASIDGDRVTISGSNTSANGSQKSASQVQQSPFQYIAKPQFAQFYGFGSDKGVSYNVWRFEVQSAISEGFHANEVISEQIRRSLQAEAKTKLIGLDSGTAPDAILKKLDQFYSDIDAATGDEILSAAYRMKQREDEEVAAYASRLDNHIRKAKTHGTELLPDELAVDKHLRLLFWEGLKDSVKDKARHKKDSCKTFADLINAARYGEREINSTQGPKRSARVNQATAEENTNAGPPSWLAEVCSAVKETLAPQIQPSGPFRASGSRNQEDPRDPPQFFREDPNHRRQLPTCFRCGQIGHVRKGCRNPPQPEDMETVQGNGRTPSAWGGRR